MDIPYGFLISHTHIYIYFLNMFHIFSLVYFLTYGVNRRQVLIAKPRFYFQNFKFYDFYILINHFMFFFIDKICFWEASTQNHAEPSGNYLKKSVLDPKRAKLDQKSEHGHVHHVPKAPSEGEILQKTKDLSSLDSIS